ncbi:MAG: Arylsulfatase A/Predicted pyrophosphatase or phosphodiesterase [Verrucomicrobia bacterium]|jgi:predicted AlkP superfamily pyrophosphatase or phosphodiesterase|nr:MAG: Arylsulfatase A/Predicted pyrophosphatase or phosphodiesterase [Verrucomicrobiota bacterium]
MRNLLLAALLFTAVILLCGQGAESAPRPARPLPAVEHVVILIVDGLRPDVLLLSETPAMHGMIRDGAYTMWARTTDMAVTLPSCTSLLTAVKPAKHRVSWNTSQPASGQLYPAVPTVLGMATEAGYVTALVAGKSKFAALAKPGTVTHVFVPDTAKCSDEQVAAEAVKIIESAKPALICIHFPGPDAVGHEKGWGSPEQLAQLVKTDVQIALVLAALDRAEIRDSTVVLLTADHGGTGKGHGADDMRSRHIPWVVAGPGVKPGYDLTQDAKLQVNTEDTGATVCWLLGLPRPLYFDGKPVTAAFVQ